MEGVITAIVAFLFVCILFPKLVKNRAQFYVAFAIILFIILLDTLAEIFLLYTGFSRFLHVMIGLSTIAALLMIVLATGGLSLKDLGGEFLSAFEVIRRGESEKEIIVPLTGEVPKARKTTETTEVPVNPPIATPTKKPEDASSIPME